MDGTVVNLPVQGQTVIAVQITPVMVTLANMDEITVRARCPRPTSPPSRSVTGGALHHPRARRAAYEGKVGHPAGARSEPANAVFATLFGG